MSFSIELIYNQSESNKIGKTLSTLSTISGTIRGGSSILNPDILAEVPISTLKGCNYMYIPEFGRYYFMTGIEAETNGLSRISGRVDVLETYKTQILAQTAIIERQQNKWNLYIEDGIFREYANPNIIFKAFPSGFTSQQFVLAVAGGTD